MITIGTVRKDAGATKSLSNQVAIEVIPDQVTRSGNLGSRHVPGQVAARVGGCHIELQYCLWQVVQFGHECLECVGKSRTVDADAQEPNVHGKSTNSRSKSENCLRGKSLAPMEAR